MFRRFVDSGSGTLGRQEEEQVGARKLIALAGALAGFLIVPATASAVEQTFTETVPIGTVGPYEVKLDTKGPIPVPPAAEGGYITKMETDIVDSVTGQPVPISRLMLHHIVFANVRQPDATCTNFLGFDSQPGAIPFAPQRFYAAGEERAKVSLPPGYGYPIEATPQQPIWGVTYMVMNHRNVSDNARIQYTVTYETDPVGAGLEAVKPYWLDVRDCRADPIYNVPGVAKKAKKKKGGKKDNGKASAAKGKRKGKGKKRKKKKPAPPVHTESRDYTIPTAGRIVAGAGHVHGGAYELNVTQPQCGNRQVAESLPTWGLPDHPFYTVRPVLHEPGPINMSAFQTPTGLPIGAGGQLRLNSVYDNAAPHTRVMGIYIIYVAPDPAAQTCDPLPGDVSILKTDQPGRSGPIPYTIPLTGLDQAGNAVTIDGPAGEMQKASSGSVVQVQDRLFDRPNLKLKQGSSLTYQFSGQELHNLTLANGPLGIGSDNLDGNRTFTQKFDRAGTYRFFCGLHPVQMSQKIVVEGKKKKKKRRKK
jgi:plastocyanin